MASKAAEFRDVAPADGGGDEVAEGVGSIVAAEALFVDVGFEDVGGLVGVVLEERETFQEALAALMDEERGWDAGVGIAEASSDSGSSTPIAGQPILWQAHLGGLPGAPWLWAHSYAANEISAQLNSATAKAARDYTFTISGNLNGWEWRSGGWGAAILVAPVERKFTTGLVCDSPPQLPQVKFAPDSTTDLPASVTLSVPGHASAVIYYTLDGSDPTRASWPYVAGTPINITTKTIIKAFATEPTAGDSIISSAVYGGPCPVPDGLVAWWSGEDNMEDRTGRHNGLCRLPNVDKPEFGIGKVGRAFAFSRWNSSKLPVSVLDDSSLALTDAFTIEGWIRHYGRNGGYVFTRGNDMRTAYQLRSEPTASPIQNVLRFCIASDVADDNLKVSVPVSGWNHFAAVYEYDETIPDPKGKLSLYVNGALVGVKTTEVRPLADLGTSGAASIGSPVDGRFVFSGLVDELAIYSRALTGFEIARIWMAGSDGKIPGPAVATLPAVLSAQPLSQTAREGYRAALSVVAEGTDLTYAWQKFHPTIGAWVDVDNTPGFRMGTRRAPYLIWDHVATTDAGTYRVVVSKAGGLSATSEDLTLAVNADPRLSIRTQPQSQTAVEGDSVAFTVVADGTPTITYQWKHDGAVIAGATASTLVINSVVAADAGSYVVTLDNPAPNTLDSDPPVTLNVHGPKPPSITEQPADRRVALGETATFTVAVDGTGPMAYQWYSSGGSISGATTSSYTTPDVQLSDNEKHFWVEVQNRMGSTYKVRSTDAVLRVGDTGPPEIVAIVPASCTKSVGENVTFSVCVRNVSPVSFQWLRNGEEIPGATGDFLFLRNVELYDAGNYSVRVSNEHGPRTSGTAELTVNAIGDGLPRLTQFYHGLKLPVRGGGYPLSIKDLLPPNSDAANVTMFKVDHVISGSLTINGTDFDAALNFTIDATAWAVWTPPETLVTPAPAAFSVRGADGAQHVTGPVDVHIVQKPKTRLYAWGRNYYSSVGNGYYWNDADWIYWMGEEATLGHRPNDLDWQASMGLIPKDPRWKPYPIEAGGWQHDWETNAQRVMDAPTITSICADQWMSSAVSADGTVWQFGTFGSFLSGLPVATYRPLSGGKPGPQKIWRWGTTLPDPSENLLEGPPILAFPSARRYNVPRRDQGQQPLAGVKSMCGGFGWRLALKDDGSLWSWGWVRDGVLGRDPGEADDRFVHDNGEVYGISPRQVEIGGPVAEVRAGGTSAIARCQDGSIWWWGAMSEGYGEYGGWECLFTGTDRPWNWMPERLTCFDSGPNAPPNPAIAEMSVNGNHYMFLKANGEVWEMGYIPSKDPQGSVGLYHDATSEAQVEACYCPSSLNLTPVKVQGGLPANIISIAAGNSFGAALTGDGTVWVWGYVGPEGGTAVRAVAGLAGITKIAAGHRCLLALDKLGRVWGWGYNYCGVLGHGDGGEFHDTPVRNESVENVTDVFLGLDVWADEWSAAANAFAIGTEPDPNRIALTATPMDAKVKLTWVNCPVGAQQYVIYRSLDRYEDYELIGTATGNEYLDQNPQQNPQAQAIANNTTYYYRVAALVNRVETGMSWEESAMPVAPPEAPEVPRLADGCRSILVSWDMPAGRVSGFRVWRALSSGGDYVQVGGVAGTSLQFNDVTVTSGIGYGYRVEAFNASGGGEPCKSPPATITFTPQCEPTPSELLFNVALNADGLNATASLSWNFKKPLNSFTSKPLSGFRVFYRYGHHGRKLSVMSIDLTLDNPPDNFICWTQDGDPDRDYSCTFTWQVSAELPCWATVAPITADEVQNAAPEVGPRGGANGGGVECVDIVPRTVPGFEQVYLDWPEPSQWIYGYAVRCTSSTDDPPPSPNDDWAVLKDAMNDCRYWHTDLSPWSFGPADIKKACDVLGVDSDMGLTEKLFHSWSGNNPVPLLADPVSAFLWGRMESIPSTFSPTRAEEINSSWPAPTANATASSLLTLLHNHSFGFDASDFQDARADLANALKEIIQGGSIYNASRFPDGSLSQNFGDGPPTFVADDLIDLPAFAAALTAQNKDAVSVYIWGRLLTETQSKLTSYASGTGSKADVIAALVTDLNTVVNGTCIYESARFAEVTRSPVTLTLQARAPASGDPLRQLNRLLLEDAYRNKIARRLNNAPPTDLMKDAYVAGRFTLPEHEKMIWHLNRLLLEDAYPNEIARSTEPKRYQVLMNNGAEILESQVVSAAPLREPTLKPALVDSTFGVEGVSYDGKVLVKWAIPRIPNRAADGNDQTKWQFFVERKLAAQGNDQYAVLTETGMGLAYLDRDVVNQSTYTYRVTAIDDHYQCYQAVTAAMTPLAGSGVVLLDPEAGNGYVDLNWNQMVVSRFVVKHSLNADGPFEVVETLWADASYRNARTTFRHAGVDNGVKQFYKIVAVLPEGTEMESPPPAKSATPLGTLPPLPPQRIDWEIESVLVGNDRVVRIVLSWPLREGADRYQVFIRDQARLTLLQDDRRANCVFQVPADTLPGTELTFAVRGVNANGLPGEPVEKTITYHVPENAPSADVAPVVVEVAGQRDFQAGQSLVGPTNLVLSAKIQLGGVQRVSFYADGSLVDTVEASGADQTSFQTLWRQVPGGHHSVKAVARSSDANLALTTGKPGTYESPPVDFNVTIQPELSAFQTAVTDLQLPAPGLPIVLSRSYTSRDTAVGGDNFALGWKASWKGAALRLSTGLNSGWKGGTCKFLDSVEYYTIGEASPHLITIRLPDNQEVFFAPSLRYYPVNHPMFFEDLGGSAEVTVAVGFDGFGLNQGTLSYAGLDQTWAVKASNYEQETWKGQTLSFDGFDPGELTYVTPDGTRFRFTRPTTGDQLTWPLQQVTDRNENTLTYAYETPSLPAAPPVPEVEAVPFSGGLGSGTDGLVQYAWTYVTTSGNTLLGGVGAIAAAEVGTGEAARVSSELEEPPDVAARLLWRFCYSIDQWVKIAAVAPITEYFDDAKDEETIVAEDDFTRPDFSVPTRLTSITHSCGRKVTFDYTTAHEIHVFDNAHPDPQTDEPVIKYVFDGATDAKLQEVKRLVDRDSNEYETTTYVYGTTGGDQNRLTEIYDARNVRVLANDYMEDDPPTGNLSSQTDAAGRTTTFTLDQFNNLSVTRSLPGGGSHKAEIFHDASGAISSVAQPADDSGGTQVASTLSYDRGLVVAQENADGKKKTFSYDTQDRLVGQTDENGVTTSVQLNEYGQPDITWDAKGAETVYVYDGQGNPLTIRDPSGTSTEYRYLEVKTAEASGSNPGYSLGKRTLSERRDAPLVDAILVTEYTYYGDNSVSDASAPSKGDLRAVTEKWVQVGENGADQTIGTPIVTHYEYDANGNRTAEIRQRTKSDGTPEFIKTVHTYDGLSRVTDTQAQIGGAATGPWSDVPYTHTHTVYGPMGKQAETTDGYGRTAYSFYDVSGNLIETKYPDGTVSRTSYDAEGRPQYVQDRAKPSIADGPTTAPATKTEYDASGRAVKVLRYATVTMTKYLAETTGFVALGGNANNVLAEYRNRMEATWPGTVLTVTRTQYDAVGRVRYSMDTLGNVTENGYDAGGRRTSITLHLTPLSDLNATYLTPACSSCEGCAVTRYEYDANGNQTAVTDANGHVTTYTYDAANRCTQTTFLNDAGDSMGTRQTAYDGLGRRYDETDEDNVLTSYRYDFRGLLTSVKQAVGTANEALTQYAYDELGNLISQRDAEKRVTQFAYDALGRRTHRVLPGGTFDDTPANTAPEKTTYDAVQVSLSSPPVYMMQKTVRDFRGRTITYEYDTMDRLTNAVPAGTDAGGYTVPAAERTTVSYAYNSAGQLSRVTQSGGTSRTVRYAYDDQRRLRVKWMPEGTLTYAYTNIGPITNISARYSYNASLWPEPMPAAGYVYNSTWETAANRTLATDRAEWHYRYDRLGRLSKVNPDNLTDASPADATYTYNAVGALASTTYRNGLVTTYTYNERNWLRRIRTTGAFGMATFDYDEAGNEATPTAPSTWGDRLLSPTGQRRRAKESYCGISRTVNYDYDALRRLTQEDITLVDAGRPWGTIKYAASDPTHPAEGYDLVGNRQWRKVTSPSLPSLVAVGVTDYENHTFDARDRLNVDTQYTYDANGNTTRFDSNANGPGDDATYVYDAENRLIARTGGGLATIEIVYDADGNRVKKAVTPTGGLPTVTTYLVEDRNPTGYAQVMEETTFTAPAATGLVGYWPLDEGSGTVAGDASGQGNNGTLINSPGWMCGRIGGGALNFSGNNYVSVPNSPELQVGASGADFSVSYWLLLEAGYTGSYRVLMFKGSIETERTPAMYMRPEANRIHYRISTTAGSNEGRDSLNTVAVNQWTHVGYVKAGNQLRLYLNGVLDSAVTLAGTSVANTSPWYMGRRPNQIGADCQMDDVRVYARALSGGEVAAMAGTRVRYVYGLDLVNQSRSSGSTWTTTYYGYDGLGSVRHLTSAAGTLHDHYAYDAFGILISSGGVGSANAYLYTGEQWDADLKMYYLRARYLNPTTGRFWTMDSYEGSQSDPLSLHKYLYAAADPVCRVDPSGHEGDLITTSGAGGLMSGLGAHMSGAVMRAYVSAMLRLPQIMYVGEQTLFWVGVGTAGFTLAADAMEWSANFSESLNRRFSRNTVPIEPGASPRGFQIERFAGQAIQEVGGEYLGGNVKGIDGVAKVPSGQILIQVRSHDLPLESLKARIEQGMTALSDLDPRDVRGTTGPNATTPNINYQLPRGPIAGRFYVVGVPANQARAIIDPSFIQWLRTVSERTRSVPIIGAVNKWRGQAR